MNTDTIQKDAAVNFRNTLVRIIRRTLGLPETVALPMAEELAQGLQGELGGLYIPKREMRESRNEAIRQSFTGRNHAEVCRRFNISRRQFYRVIGGE